MLVFRPKLFESLRHCDRAMFLSDLAAGIIESRHDSNQELIGQDLARVHHLVEQKQAGPKHGE